ncbi:MULTISPECIES: DUF3306 domain-containing protein [unclassified Phaeobacter]|uniref:DUF3306 domain-containing protein n=1 Tax=unclassified Phaeobacter TaxID=2621772 RepID=UPI003A848D06
MSRDDFWSRRRARVAAEQEAEAAEVAAAARQAAEEALEEKSDAEILQELNLPDPDEMQQGDDFSVFLKETIPARIRTRALRRLWTSNPILANVDGLLDYGEDFTDSAMVIENLQTAYQVGKGMTAHVEELARQAEEAAATTADTEQEAEALAAEETVAAVAPHEAASCDSLQAGAGQAETAPLESVRRPTMGLQSPSGGADPDHAQEAAARMPSMPTAADPVFAAVADPVPDPVASAPRRMRFTFAADTNAPAT